MLSFTVTKPRQTLEKQWAFLVKKGQDKELKGVLIIFILLLLLTVLYLLFYFLTALNDFIVFKGVAMFMIALSWCAAIILCPLHIALGKRKSKRRLQNFLNAISDAELSYSVQIDEEKVVIVSPHEVRESPWTEFTDFGINEETLYVFNTVKGIHSLYWDKTEIGSEAYSALLEMLKRKAIRQAF